jgi:hypothetical protein
METDPDEIAAASHGASKDAKMEINKDEINVSDDNIFLQLLLEKHNINAKQLACWTGRASSTIYKYLSGEITIPSVVWRSIFDHTLDVAVFNVVRGDIPCVIAPLDKVGISLNAASLSKLLEVRKRQLKCEEYVLQILADGKVDASDIAAIANYKLAFPDMVSSQAQIYQAILNAHAKAEAQV